jgi:hypothetical protein
VPAKDYTVSIWPNSNDQNDREAAEMGENFLRWLEPYDDERHIDEKEKIAIFMLLCGTAFDRTYVSMEDDGWVFDKAGNPIKTGNVVSECLSPFSFAGVQFWTVRTVWAMIFDCVNYK